MRMSPPEARSPAAGLGARARGGMLWAGLSVVVTLALQLGFGAVMARLLDPATFGLMAMALVTLKLFSYLSQIGLSMTLGAMQRQVMTDDDLRLSLGVVWLASAVSIAAILVMAPVAAGFFGRPELSPLVRALSISLLLQALANVSVSLLRRQLRFRMLALVEVLGYAVGYGLVGVLTALAGWGVWSLAAATVSQALLTLALAYALTRHPMLPKWRGAQAGHWQYGARHTVISFSEFVSANADSLLIGRLIGDAALGLYNRAHVLVYQPVEKAAGIITRVLFPVVTAIQADRAKVGALFVLGVGVIGVLAGVTGMSVAAAADDLVAVLLGDQWTAAVPLVRLLGFAVPAIFMSNIAGVLCDAMNLLRFKLRLQLAGMSVVLGLMWGLAGQGVAGIVAGLVIGEVLRFAAYFHFLAGQLAYRRRVAARALMATALASACAYTAVLASNHWLAGHGVALGWRLVVVALAAGLALGAGAVVLVRLLQHTMAGELACQHLPGWRQAQRVLGGHH